MSDQMTEAAAPLSSGKATAPDPWLTKRRGYICGSDIAAVMGRNPFGRGPLEVYAEKRGLIDPDEGRSDADAQHLRLGRAQQEIIAAEFLRKHPNFGLIYAPEEDMFLTRGDSSLGGTPDFFVVESGPDHMLRIIGVLECKAVGRRMAAHWQIGDGDVASLPQWAVDQVMFYVGLLVSGHFPSQPPPSFGRWMCRTYFRERPFLLSGCGATLDPSPLAAPRLWLAALVMGFDYQDWEIPYDPDAFAAMGNAATALWQCIETETPPAAAPLHEHSRDTLAAVYPQDPLGQIRPAEADEREWIAELIAVREAKTTAERREEELKAILAERIAAGTGILAPEVATVTWKMNADRRQTDYAKVVAALPDRLGIDPVEIAAIAEEFTRTIPGTRVFRVGKG